MLVRHVYLTAFSLVLVQCNALSMVYQENDNCKSGLLSYYQRQSLVFSDSMFNVRTVNCTNIINKFPDDMSYDGIVLLTCQTCSIPVLNGNVLPQKNFGQFQYLYLTNSGIESIEADTFANTSYSSLKKIVLDNNSISSFPDDLFDSFKYTMTLRDVSVSNNSLTTIGNAFCSGNFNRVLLQYNRITSMTTSCDNVTIDTLNLSYNELTELDWSIFDRFYLKHFNVTHNSINRISINGLHERITNDELLQLDIGYNKIVAILPKTFVMFTKLKYLVLMNNELSELSSESFQGLTELLLLSLRGNQLDILPFGLFRDLNKLSSLNLASNRLSELSIYTFSGLLKLIDLNLADNYITHLKATDLTQLASLERLDISGNRLQRLDLPAILSRHKLTTLLLKNNFWDCSALIDILSKKKLERIQPVEKSTHFLVSNIHGIPCSTRNVSSFDPHMKFEEFLIEIQDANDDLAKMLSNPMDDLLEEKKRRRDRSDAVLDKISGLVLLIAVVVVVDFVFRWLYKVYQVKHTIHVLNYKKFQDRLENGQTIV